MTKKIANRVSQVIEKVSSAGYSVNPGAKVFITNECIKGRAVGTIDEKDDCQVVASALIAAGMKIAEGKNSTIIGIKDIKEGWGTILGGTCPPHKCLKTTIIEKVDKIEEILPSFKKLIKDI